MDAMTKHWDGVYDTKGDVETSWFTPSAADSLAMLDQVGVIDSDSVIDIGGGTSRLVDELLARGHRDLAVLDIAASALRRSQDRLGTAGTSATWFAADVTTWHPSSRYQVWHDRAVFHFLTSPEARAAYSRTMRRALGPDGIFVMGTFAPTGPDQCSGLPVSRYDADGLAHALGPDVEVLHHRQTEHVTPWGAIQPFTWIAGRLDQTVASGAVPSSCGGQ